MIAQSGTLIAAAHEETLSANQAATARFAPYKKGTQQSSVPFPSLIETRMLYFNLLGSHDNANAGGNFRVQLQSDVVLASLTQRTFRHTNFAFGNVDSGRCDGISQVARTDGTEQLTFVTGFSHQRQFDFAQLLRTVFSFRFTQCSLAFELSATRFERFNVFLGCRYGQAVRYQVVTAIARFNGDFVTQIAELTQFVE
ncbi:hypothetical protein ZBT109_2098 [Zymobacter palmae]|uniref:Uncharacterized protein n=1 Tax=Zymobacter palmae TaxID=33074 RepID=A0A348HGU0_9GAMM|nr:hypothetical protein ZBT109_2098 [Zymobacter palmae]